MQLIASAYDCEDRLWVQVLAWSQHGSAAQKEQALIQLAFLLALERRGDESHAVAARLLREHPQSRFVPLALLVLAESLFERGTAAR